MRRSAVSVWMGRLTSSCPAPTASVRSASISGKSHLLLQPLIIAKQWVASLLPSSVLLCSVQCGMRGTGGLCLKEPFICSLSRLYYSPVETQSRKLACFPLKEREILAAIPPAAFSASLREFGLWFTVHRAELSHELCKRRSMAASIGSVKMGQWAGMCIKGASFIPPWCSSRHPAALCSTNFEMIGSCVPIYSVSDRMEFALRFTEQERPQQELPNLPLASDRRQRVMGHVWRPHGGGYSGLYPQLGRWSWNSTQTLNKQKPNCLYSYSFVLRHYEFEFSFSSALPCLPL